MPSLRDALSEAFDAAEEGTLEAPVEREIAADQPQDDITAKASEGERKPPEETAAQRTERERDERGRYAARTAGAAQPNVPVEAPGGARKPPTSWRKDYHAHWEKFDPQLKDYIDQREREYANGVSTYKNQWDQAAPVLRALEPYIPELQRQGVAPDRWIADLGHVHTTFARGTQEQKAQLLVQIATNNGIDLRQLVGQGQGDPQFGQLASTVSGLQQRIQAYESANARAENTRLQQQIDAFKATAPDFEEVRETMAGLLRNGLAPDLKTAYDKAIRLNDDVWARHLDRQSKAALAERQKQLAGKRAASSPRSTSPTGAATTGSGKKSLRDNLLDAFEEHASTRF